MASLEEIRLERLKKLELLKERGVNPYPSESRQDHTLAEAAERFDELSADGDVSLVGRVMAMRGQGALVFVDLYDGTGRLQALIKKDNLPEESFALFQDAVDIGDFVEVAGNLFVTKREEKTIEAKSWRMLSKSLRPLPDKWHGLQDEEERLRRRYLDMLVNPETRDIAVKRSRFWSSMREFLLARGFFEVETPVLENTAGGAEARPFVTHHNALDLDVYLRISPELWLKRLMVAGFTKVFEIGRIFRNEGISPEHLQDYTQMEFYWAYADYRKGMKMVEELYKHVAQETFGTLQFAIKGHEIDLAKEWAMYDYRETILEKTGFDIERASLETVEAKLRELDIRYDREGFNLTRAIDTLWKYCRKQIAGPGFLVNVPVYMEPLAKRKEDDRELVERFQVLLAGSEMGKGFSELNDPLDQAGRFAEQAALREAGDEEAQMYDQDFVEALEYGMPPTCGFGVSERLFSFLMDKPVRECQLFPLMRPKTKEE
ncbi:MAG TPA: lysine--tRNA ligase [Candidatus Paceibacterota bacterium]|nr:lysine--tRNA ligase [Candidatus Paceibacterota bacterium]